MAEKSDLWLVFLFSSDSDSSSPGPQLWNFKTRIDFASGFSFPFLVQTETILQGMRLVPYQQAEKCWR
ncbi:hypothetical protein DM860_008539 [Cuscuta australis]|uniref:Uncharacterized protein n=1 Tax=Cuscuta australis TaxID=267555 RepID=A0A328D960_9ASTE|nr:hypothetical protein DM860_008539 [Cuscuta australis]